MKRRGWTVVAGAVVIGILLVLLAQFRVPYVALAPGRTVNTLGTLDGKPVIAVENATTSASDGELTLTTVTVYDGIDLFTALRWWFDPEIAVVPRETIYPSGKSDEEVEKESEADWVASQDAAEVSALRVLGYPVQVMVDKVRPDSPATDQLAPGDVITSVNGAATESAPDFLEDIAEVKPGETADIGYERAGVAGTATVPVQAAGDKGTARKTGDIDVVVKQEQPHDFDISFDVDGIGGPSAGLMFALGIVDKLDPDDLTGGLSIAGTGTIDDDGAVGAIGGIPQKMVSARDVGATVFLVPAENCQQAARTKPDDLRLVKVATLDDALAALGMLRDKRGTPPTC